MSRFTEFDFGVSWVMGFFHQDWMYDGDTAADVVAKWLGESIDEAALAVRRDAQTLSSLPSETLEVLWEAGSYYLPSFERIGGGAGWTRTVVDLCDARLTATVDVRPLTGADTNDGMACLDAVAVEIQRARSLGPEVRTALVDCARHCTPDLALRILLRAVNCASDASLSSDQYARLEVIGSALQYGEFVVDYVKYLVEDE